MNEKINLYDKLKNCSVGMHLYSSVFGDVMLSEVEPDKIFVHKEINNSYYYYAFDISGRYCSHDDSECTLFPSKEQRDWSKFKAPVKVKRFNPEELKPYDRVLIKGRGAWKATFFSHYLSTEAHKHEMYCVDGPYGIVIPYNDETKYLVGTTDDCPDYYKWWLDDIKAY